jgi:predicted CopG family antitoxin
MCASVGIAMPNQRDPSLKRTTITVDEELYRWAIEEAKRRGINDFSTFVRTLIAAERKNKTHEKDR